jgi:sarcosine oxidase subunit gamma
VPEIVTPRGAVGPVAAPRGVRLAERIDVGKIVLRGDPSDRAFLAATGRALDIVLPTEANSSAGKAAISALWVGPDEWLITCPRERVAALIGALREALAGVHAAVTDVSDGRTVFRVAGPSARALLAKGTPLDLHPRSFKVGACAGTGLAKTAVLIQLVADDPATGPSFDVYVGRSFGRYLFAWLDDAGLEYGVQIESAV